MQRTTDRRRAEEVSVRRATTDDIPFLAQVDLIASTPPFDRSIWERYLEGIGTSTVRFLEAMFMVDASNWGSAEDFIVLEVAGTPAAACAVYDGTDRPADQGMIDMEKLPSIARRLGWTDEVSQTFRAAYEKDWKGDQRFLAPQAEAIIETVGVLPEFRRMGLGDRLMRESRVEALRRGHASIGIMVIHGNDGAKRLYERHFEPYITYHASFFGGEFPGITKYRASLSESDYGDGDEA